MANWLRFAKIDSVRPATVVEPTTNNQQPMANWLRFAKNACDQTDKHCDRRCSQEHIERARNCCVAGVDDVQPNYIARVERMELARPRTALDRYHVGLMISVLCAILPSTAIGQRLRRTESRREHSFTFGPIRMAGRRDPVYVLVHEVNVHRQYGHDVGDGIQISLFAGAGSNAPVLSSLRVSGHIFFLEASVFRHRVHGEYFLAISESQGQYEHSQVYILDANKLKLRPMFQHGILCGDPTGLASGVIVEHSPRHYVDPRESGFDRFGPDGPEYFARNWRYRSKSHSFAAGRWRPEW